MRGPTINLGAGEKTYAASGTLIWDPKREGRVYSKPAIAGTVVYFGCGDHRLYALDAKSGKELWSFAAGGMVCYPSIYDGKLFFGSGQHLYVLE